MFVDESNTHICSSMFFKHYNMETPQNAALEISYGWLLERKAHVTYCRIIDLGNELYTEKSVPVSVLLTVLAWNNIY